MKWNVVKPLAFVAAAAFIAYRLKSRMATARNGKSLLWEISGNGLSTPSYLFGTMHLMCAEQSHLSKNVLRVLGKVKIIYLEVDMDNAGELLGGMVDFNIRDNGTLADFLIPEDYELVKSFFEKHQPYMPFELLERQHPLMLSSSLYELFLPCEQKNGIELRIVEEAERLNKQTRGIETLAFQGEIFNSIPYEQQARDLVKTIRNIEHFKHSMHEIISVYHDQDIDKLLELSLQEDSGVSGHMEVLLYNRNHTWIDQIYDISKRQSTLFAVGAGHLAGEQGLLHLLKAKGFKLRPLRN